MLQPLGATNLVSLQFLEETYRECEWGECARVATLESKAQVKASKRTCRISSTDGDGASSSRVAVAPGTLDPRTASSPSSEIDKLFGSILSSIDAHDWETARENVLQLQKCLKVTSGREGRERGGWQYAADFVLDSVLFADLLRNLQSDTDVLSKAVRLSLGWFAE